MRPHICGNTNAIVTGFGRLGCDIVDLDDMVPLERARQAMGPDQVLLGNLDPVRDVRDGTALSIREWLAACHRAAGERYIVGAGCELPRDTPPANVRAFSEDAYSHRP